MKEIIIQLIKSVADVLKSIPTFVWLLLAFIVGAINWDQILMLIDVGSKLIK